MCFGHYGHADIFPQINVPVVSVIWQYAGLSTPEVEQRRWSTPGSASLAGTYPGREIDWPNGDELAVPPPTSQTRMISPGATSSRHALPARAAQA
jgi:hypothetical protein